MTRTRQKWLTLAAALGLVHWLFGNLYEAIVFSPNWVVDSAAQLQRLNEFFVNTSPTLYFVPVTTGATVLVWVLAALNRDPALARHYKLASVFAAVATSINVFIVATIIPKLFGADYLVHSAQLGSYSRHWNVMNVLRMAAVAATLTPVFNAFRALDRARC